MNCPSCNSERIKKNGHTHNGKQKHLCKDRTTKQIVGFHIGGRKKTDAKKLWRSLPGVYHRCAVCYSDFWEAYE
ncbi:hypothetical protein KA005_53835 [bacterium]|nr:hypothetical protein [bacterium]